MLDKVILETKNGKIEAILELRNLEDRFKEQQREFKDKEDYLKQSTANELR